MASRFSNFIAGHKLSLSVASLTGLAALGTGVALFFLPATLAAAATTAFFGYSLSSFITSVGFQIAALSAAAGIATLGFTAALFNGANFLINLFTSKKAPASGSPAPAAAPTPPKTPGSAPLASPTTGLNGSFAAMASLGSPSAAEESSNPMPAPTSTPAPISASTPTTTSPQSPVARTETSATVLELPTFPAAPTA